MSEEEDDNLTWDQLFAQAKDSLQTGRKRFVAGIETTVAAAKKFTKGKMSPDKTTPDKTTKPMTEEKVSRLGRYCKCSDGGTRNPTTGGCSVCNRQIPDRIAGYKKVSSCFNQQLNYGITVASVSVNSSTKYWLELSEV